jgi:hypothetical protein
MNKTAFRAILFPILPFHIANQKLIKNGITRPPAQSPSTKHVPERRGHPGRNNSRRSVPD